MDTRAYVWLANNLDKYIYIGEGIKIRETILNLNITEKTIKNSATRKAMEIAYFRFLKNFENNILINQRMGRRSSISSTELDCYFIEIPDGMVPIGFYREIRPVETMVMIKQYMKECQIKARELENELVNTMMETVAKSGSYKVLDDCETERESLEVGEPIIAGNDSILFDSEKEQKTCDTRETLESDETIIQNEANDEKHIDKFDGVYKETTNGERYLKIMFAIAVIVIIITGSATFASFIAKMEREEINSDFSEDINVQHVEQTVLDEVYEYLEGFYDEEKAPVNACILVGQIKTLVSDDFKGTIYFNEKDKQEVTFKDAAGAKNFMMATTVPLGQDCAFVVQLVGEGEEAVCYVRDVVVLPALGSYDIEKGFDPQNIVVLEGENAEEKLAFYNKLVQYVGVQQGKFEIAQEFPT